MQQRLSLPAAHCVDGTDDYLSGYEQHLYAPAGELGNALQRVARERTESLKPDHDFVPWVVVNGVPLFEDFDNVKLYICAAYNNRGR
jgi:hypothetical protein